FVFLGMLLIIAVTAGVAMAQKDFWSAFETGGIMYIILLCIAGVVGIVVLVLQFMGLSSCCAAPEKNHAYTLARASLWLFVGTLVMPFINCLIYLVVGAAVFGT